MEDVVKTGDHLTSVAAFVEGGIQEACDDACSICLEEFIESDPSTVTGCKHEFHLQCILEWCQRSSQCPMCWQSISLKDPSSQELLDAIEREKSVRVRPSRNTTIFHHPTLGDFELQHLPASATDAELEERIIQHLAAAANMGRARHREGQQSRSSAQGRPHFLVFSRQQNDPPLVPMSSPTHGSEDEPTSVVTIASGSVSPVVSGEEDSRDAGLGSASASGSTVSSTSHLGTSFSNQSPCQTSPRVQDGAGPSEFQTFSESLKSRLSSVSTRYKETITKSTRGWKEKLFSRNSNMADLRSEVRREVNAGIATVSQMMERLETRDNNRTHSGSVSNPSLNTLNLDAADQHIAETGANHSSNDSKQATSSSGSASC